METFAFGGKAPNAKDQMGGQGGVWAKWVGEKLSVLVVLIVALKLF